MTILSNFHKNNMGTLTFNAKFGGMRKPQEFDVYPIDKPDPTSITIQSDTRMGSIRLADGAVTLTPSIKNGAGHYHLARSGARVPSLSSEDLLMLKGHIMTTASGRAGTNGVVFTDNSGALDVFAAQPA